ncbi:Hypothetical Protein FCC1311_017312 [Hondaea fermentalgiana]|uniref:Xaa-Pro dipeptidyl-peptidase C-terminal domain-containing protein n=1 Tax=Hondaea fermentalgiana TaxID=2315210 RepID=A0A2R5G3C2_9STRA|nr:Hypothetical Protein FCC1311_017312 [Hondaea fermentalgiana]|eukprot:GBG25512.1 Hypothetical Protein FCC1311_017312 [Hondaea fermentalgiana]
MKMAGTATATRALRRCVVSGGLLALAILALATPRALAEEHSQVWTAESQLEPQPGPRTVDSLLTGEGIWPKLAGFDKFIHRAKDAITGQTQQGEPERFVSRHQVAMRDGVLLDTVVIRPSLELGERRPTLLARSPYGPTSDQIADLFVASNDMVAVIQDQRGTFLSGGKFSMWKNDGEDGYDTMAWIAKQSWSNGEVYTAGISADACGAFAQIVSRPPWLKGQFLMLASGNAHETIYPGGAFREGLIEGWMASMAASTRGHSLLQTLPEIKAHEALSSWYSKVEADNFVEGVAWPTVHLSGWWDIFCGHHLRAFDALSARSHPAVRRNHTIFVGPSGHCELFNPISTTSLHESKAWVNAYGYVTEAFAGRWGPFRRRVKRVNFFVQGPTHFDGNWPHDGNYWTSLDDWPLSKPWRLYLADENTLSSSPAAAASNPGILRFRYHPSRPVPTRGGTNLILAMLGHGCGSEDQSANEKRDDVLVFTTPRLKDSVAVTGRIFANLFVSSSARDTDFVVSLTDVYPDGERSMLVRSGMQRMRWRDDPRWVSKPMEPGKVYNISLDLWPTSYVFNREHSIRVTVTSSSAPYYKPNPNSDEDIDEEHFWDRRSATNAIHFSAEHPSHVELPVVKLYQLPQNHDF